MSAFLQIRLSQSEAVVLRPTPKPIKWRVDYEGFTLTTVSSVLLDGHYYLNKTYYTHGPWHTHAVQLVDKNDTTVASEDSAAKLLKTLYRREGAARLPRVMPETFAALASITSNEDWENLDA